MNCIFLKKIHSLQNVLLICNLNEPDKNQKQQSSLEYIVNQIFAQDDNYHFATIRASKYLFPHFPKNINDRMFYTANFVLVIEIVNYNFSKKISKHKNAVLIFKSNTSWKRSVLKYTHDSLPPKEKKYLLLLSEQQYSGII